MGRRLVVNPGDLWAIEIAKAHRFFASPDGPRALEAMGMAPRESSRESAEVGTAVIPVVGPIAKDTWVEMWGGTSSLSAQAAVQAARHDRGVDSVFLLIDSPGGEVAGLQEFADEVLAAAAEMPVHAHIDDIGASAAYWVACSADTVSVNATGYAGSIGAIAQVADVSKALEEAGVELHTIRSGDRKAELAGPAITEAALASLQEDIDHIGRVFADHVEAARGLSAEVRADVADGRLMRADEALRLGLVDSISSRQAAFDLFRTGLDAKAKTGRRARAAIAKADALRAKARRY